MSNNCEMFSRIEPALVDGTLSDSDRTVWNQHRQTCPVCQEQWTMHQQLKAIHIKGASPSDNFSDRFWSQATTARQQERTQGRLSNTARIVLWLYWIAAGVASLLILFSRIEWSTAFFTHPWLPYITAVLTPIGFLLIFSADRIRQHLLRWLVFLFR